MEPAVTTGIIGQQAFVADVTYLDEVTPTDIPNDDSLMPKFPVPEYLYHTFHIIPTGAVGSIQIQAAVVGANWNKVTGTIDWVTLDTVNPAGGNAEKTYQGTYTHFRVVPSLSAGSVSVRARHRGEG